MNVAIIVAIFVSILGFSSIIAAVWLWHKWRGTRVAAKSPALNKDNSPLKRLAIDHGKTIRVPGPRPPSVISGWSSVRHRSWLLSSISINRHDDASFRDSRHFKRRSYRLGPDLEQGIKEIGIEQHNDNRHHSLKTPPSDEQPPTPHLPESPTVPSSPKSNNGGCSAMLGPSPLKALPSLPPTQPTSSDIIDFYWRPSIYKDVPSKSPRVDTPSPPPCPLLGRTFLDASPVETLQASPRPARQPTLRSKYSLQRLPSQCPS